MRPHFVDNEGMILNKYYSYLVLKLERGEGE